MPTPELTDIPQKNSHLSSLIVEALLQNQTIKCRAVKVQCLALGTPDGAVVLTVSVRDYATLWIWSTREATPPTPPCGLSIEVAKEKFSKKT